MVGDLVQVAAKWMIGMDGLLKKVMLVDIVQPSDGEIIV
jgi:hypothetical protein